MNVFRGTLQTVFFEFLPNENWFNFSGSLLVSTGFNVKEKTFKSEHNVWETCLTIHSTIYNNGTC